MVLGHKVPFNIWSLKKCSKWMLINLKSFVSSWWLFAQVLMAAVQWVERAWWTFIQGFVFKAVLVLCKHIQFRLVVSTSECLMLLATCQCSSLKTSLDDPTVHIVVSADSLRTFCCSTELKVCWFSWYCMACVGFNLHNLATPYLWFYVDIWQDNMVPRMTIRCAEYKNWLEVAIKFLASSCMCPFSCGHMWFKIFKIFCFVLVFDSFLWCLWLEYTTLIALA